MKKTIWAHTLVKNEDRYLWFAVKSIIDYVDKILLWDTGSSDQTLAIISELKKDYDQKISFKEAGEVDAEQFTKIRQEMLDQTKSDWVLILDGDEVWWESSIKKLEETIQKEGDQLELIVSPYYNLIGDIYHFQEETAGKYQIDRRLGHLNIRAINRKIPGLHLEKPHGQQGFYDQKGVLIQNRPDAFHKFIDAKYLHFTNLRRSSSLNSDSLVPKRSLKYKYEIGITFPENFRYPEVFYQPYPQFISSPWQKMSKTYLIRASAETVLKKVKRCLMPFQRVGY